MVVGARHRGVRLRRRPALDHRPRQRRRGGADLARPGRRPDGPHPAPRRQGQLLADGRDGSVRTVLGDPHRSRSGLRSRRRAAGRSARRPVHGVLEPRLHAVQPGARRHPDAVASAVDRHRRRPRTDPDPHPGCRRGLGDGPDGADHRGRLQRHRPEVPRRRLRRHRQLQPAGARRARPIGRDARVGRRLPVEREPGLRAPADPASRHPPRLPARRRQARDALARRHRDHGDGRRLPGAGGEPRLRDGRDHARGGAVPPDAEDRTDDPRPRARRGGRERSAAAPRSCCTTRTGSRSR